MEEYIKENISLIKRMVLENFHGVMEESIEVCGKMENSMEKENFIKLILIGKKVFGLMGKD